ncbi:MAG: type III-B CRISPR module RAMP protein Cmr4 [Blastocatellia bacterium]
MEARLAFVHALSPLHAGTGQGIGVIDLPIAREKATGLPFLPGSSVKGSLRDLCTDEKQQKSIFGTGNEEKSQTMEHAGSVQFSDQRLLLLPIRSLVGTFAWVTSPYILQRFVRDAKVAGINNLPESPKPLQETSCLVTTTSCLKHVVNNNSKVFLEDLDLTPSNNNTEVVKASNWANWLASKIFADAEWQDMLKARFCIVSDDLLSFLLETATEVSARIVIDDETKTAKKGGLWYEETLPTETILSGLVMANPPTRTGLEPGDIFKKIEEITSSKTVQFGGKATVGHGLCSVKLIKQ